VAFIRKRSVTLDEVTVKIAPLFSKQVEDFLAQQDKILDSVDLPVEQKAKSMERLWLQLVATSIDNAARDGNFEPRALLEEFDPEKLLSLYDKTLCLDFLKSEIMKMSGMAERGRITGPEAKSA